MDGMHQVPDRDESDAVVPYKGLKPAAGSAGKIHLVSERLESPGGKKSIQPGTADKGQDMEVQDFGHYFNIIKRLNGVEILFWLRPRRMGSAKGVA